MRKFGMVVLLMVALNSFGQSIKPDPCLLKGTIFVESQRSRAHFSVFVDENSATVDLMVFKAERKLNADRPGLWHFTDDRAIADYIIYYEKTRAAASLIIQFTPTESFAGCNKN